VFLLVSDDRAVDEIVQPLAAQFTKQHGKHALRSAGIAASTTKMMRSWIESGVGFESAQEAANATMQRGMGFRIRAINREEAMNALKAVTQ
jgi:hypothetical protein